MPALLDMTGLLIPSGTHDNGLTMARHTETITAII